MHIGRKWCKLCWCLSMQKILCISMILHLEDRSRVWDKIKHTRFALPRSWSVWILNPDIGDLEQVRRTIWMIEFHQDQTSRSRSGSSFEASVYICMFRSRSRLPVHNMYVYTCINIYFQVVFFLIIIINLIISFD